MEAIVIEEGFEGAQKPFEEKERTVGVHERRRLMRPGCLATGPDFAGSGPRPGSRVNRLFAVRAAPAGY